MLVDGYVDEPTCLGVPPYVSIYPRYIAGAIWSHAPQTEIIYQTIDQVRMSFEQAWQMWATADAVLLIAGMIVPGKYIGGTPISVREAKELFSDSRLSSIPKVLVGPWGRFGVGREGGKVSLTSNVLSPPFDYIVNGDSELVIAQAIQSGSFSSTDMGLRRTSPSEIEPYIHRGTKIVQQYPGIERGYIICEIETYRGCPRFVSGGCSFCVEPSYGMPQMRNINDIVREIEMLYKYGVRAFRIGRQADLFAFGSSEIGEEEFPVPVPASIEELFSKIRRVAPNLQVLHIDNVNPGTIAHHPDESRQVAKSIIKYHTTGDVAAFGLESLDPEVIRRNNLKVNTEEALLAVRVLNEVGRKSPAWELPHLLPGINLLYGLPGESPRTLEYNMAFLETLLEEDLLVRRINIRQVIGFDGTHLGTQHRSRLKRHQFFRHKSEIREKIDIEMLRRVAPHGTIIHSAFVEHRDGNSLLLRPLASYPLLCHMPSDGHPFTMTDVFVVDHGPRSVTVLPFPFRANTASLSQWRCIPGIGAKRAARLKAGGRLHDLTDMESRLDIPLPDWLIRTMDFEN
ncbi:MAG: radical SAM protein [Candidatus Thorarchaeota archaeon]